MEDGRGANFHEYHQKMGRSYLKVCPICAKNSRSRIQTRSCPVAGCSFLGHKQMLTHLVGVHGMNRTDALRHLNPDEDDREIVRSLGFARVGRR